MMNQIFGHDQVAGHKVKLQATQPKHYKVEKAKEMDDAAVKSFGELFSGAMGKVNNLLIDSDKKTQQMLVRPESVSVHSVMISAQKAQLALNMTKAVTDRVVRAYQTISNLR